MKFKDKASVKYDSLTQFRRYCKCSHSDLLIHKDKKICTWCGEYIYNTPFDEFKDKLSKARMKLERGN